MMNRIPLALALLCAAPAAAQSVEIVSPEASQRGYEYDVEVLSGLYASHEVGWYPDDELAVTTLERFADLMPHVRQIAGAPPPEETLGVTMADIVRLTLENSTTLEQAHFTPRIQAHEPFVQRGELFDTVFSASANISESNRPTASALSGAAELMTRRYSMSSGLSQRLATGGLIDFTFNLSRTNTNNTFATLNPTFNNDIALEMSQPLLRGFGPEVTRAPITRSLLERDAAEEDFRGTVIDTLADSMSTHWDLFFTLRQAEVRLISLEQARVVLNNNRIRNEVGDMTRVEVLQAESVVAQREGDYFTSLRNIQDAEDSLWFQIDRSGQLRRWDTQLLPADAPRLEPLRLSEEQVVAQAFLNRPDLRAQVLRREQTEINRRVAANNLLPSLNATASVGFAGIGGEASSAVNQTQTLDFDDWAFGLSLEYPLQNRAARHGLRQAELRLEQADTGIEAQRLSIILEVRNTLRRLQNALDLLAAREAEVRARELEVSDEQRRYDFGLSTTQDLLDRQDDLANARVNRISAIVEYAQAKIELERVTGLLLERHGVVIEPTEMTMRP